MTVKLSGSVGDTVTIQGNAKEVFFKIPRNRTFFLSNAGFGFN